VGKQQSQPSQSTAKGDTEELEIEYLSLTEENTLAIEQ